MDLVYYKCRKNTENKERNEQKIPHHVPESQWTTFTFVIKKQQVGQNTANPTEIFLAGSHLVWRALGGLN